MSRLEAQNLDTIQAMQIRMNLQQLFTMDAKTARTLPRSLESLGSGLRSRPDEATGQNASMAKAEGILRSIATRPFQRRPRSHQSAHVLQAAKRKAKGYRMFGVVASEIDQSSVVYQLIAGPDCSGQFTHLK